VKAGTSLIGGVLLSPVVFIFKAWLFRVVPLAGRASDKFLFFQVFSSGPI